MILELIKFVLNLIPQDSSACDGVWIEDIVIGNPLRFRPQFEISGQRVGRPTRFALTNDDDLKIARKTWFFNFFYAPFQQTTSGSFDNFLDTHITPINPPFSSTVITSDLDNMLPSVYDSSGVYLIFYRIQNGPSFPEGELDFCFETYGTPLFIFDVVDDISINNWVSSTYFESIIESGFELIQSFTQNSDLGVLTTRNSSWRLLNSQDLDSTMREGIQGNILDYSGFYYWAI